MPESPIKPTSANRRERRCPQQSSNTGDVQDRRVRRWATLQQTADYLEVSLRTVRQMGADGRITLYRLGDPMRDRCVRIDLNEVDRDMHPAV